MSAPWSVQPRPGLWFVPALVGSILVLVGLLIYLFPQLLAYFIASVFLVVGLGMWTVAWRLRMSHVAYRRLDEQSVE